MPLLKHPSALKCIESVVARQRSVPYHLHAPEIGLYNDRLQARVMVLCSASDAGHEAERYAREHKAEDTFGGHIAQLDLLAASQVSRRLLVVRGALIISIIKIFRDEGHSLELPALIVRARSAYPRRPMGGDRPKARRRRAIIR